MDTFDSHYAAEIKYGHMANVIDKDNKYNII